MRLTEKNISNIEGNFRLVQEEMKKTPLITDSVGSKIERIKKEVFRLESLVDKTLKNKNMHKQSSIDELNNFKERLNKLHDNLEDLPFFQGKDNRSKIKRILDIKGLFFKNFSLIPRKSLFLGYNEKIYEQKLPKEIEKNLKKMESLSRKNSKKLVSERIKITLKLKNLTRFRDLNKQLASQIKLLQELEERKKDANPGEIEKLDQRIEDIGKLRVTLMESLQEMQALTEKEKMNIEATISHYEKRLNRLNSKLEKLKEVIFKGIQDIDKHKGREKVGAQMRQDCQTLGGKRITISTPDNVKLDGMFLDAKKFRQKLFDCGCKMMTLTDEAKNQKMNGIYLSKKDYDKSGKDVLDVLRRFHALHEQGGDEGVGWEVISHGEDYMIVQTRDLMEKVVQDTNKKPGNLFIEFNSELGNFKVKEEFLNQSILENIDCRTASAGTVILTSGVSGIYEMQKTEAAFFLLRNMNVMMFNFRGYGNSQGYPSPKTIRIDMESAYQAAQKFSQHPDEKIVFKALCFSGPVAAYVASKHPKTNIILDQTFADSKSIVKSMIKRNLQNDDSYLNRRPKKAKLIQLISSMVSCFVPGMGMKTAKYLAKNMGEKAIIYTHQDTFAPVEHVEKMIKKVSASKQLHKLSLLSFPGEHGELSIGIIAKPSIFSQKELESISSDILKTQRDLKKTNLLLNELRAKTEKIDEYINLTSQYVQSSKNKNIFKNNKKDLISSSSKIENFDEEMIEIERQIKEEEMKQKELQARIESFDDESFSFGDVFAQFKVNNLKIEELENQIKKLEKRSYSLLIAKSELENSNTNSPVGQNVIEHFLMKTHLMNHIIPPSISVEYSSGLTSSS